MDTPARLAAIKARLAVPAVAAPMFLVSGPDLVIAACKAGIIGSFPTTNARDVDTLDAWLARIRDECAQVAPWAVNLVVHSTSPRFAQDFACVLKYRPEIVITSLGSPARVVDEVHAYGGLVFADVNSIPFARKAVDAGADGLVLIGAGAGGHAGVLSPFAFVPAVREFFDGPIMLGGAIVGGAGVRAAEVLGADFAYLGTQFIATSESLAPQAYRDMLVAANEDDILLTPHFSGVPANFLKPSIRAAGLDPDHLQTTGRAFVAQGETRAWKHIWSAGQGVRAITSIRSTAEIVANLASEYHAAETKV